MITCPICGFDNPVKNKFCEQCGSSLEVSSDGEQVPYSSVLPVNPSHGDEQPSDNGGLMDEDSPLVVPVLLSQLEVACQTDVGRQRDHNEDYCSTRTNPPSVTSQGPVRGLYILCDGMGGHAGGAEASRLAEETLWEQLEASWFNQPLSGEWNLNFRHQNLLPDEETICDAIFAVNSRIYEINQVNSRTGSGRMGTTLVAVLIENTSIAVAHVGDSRLFRFTPSGGLEQMTVDHEVGQQEISRGVDPITAYARADAYQLTQALGPRDNRFVNPDVAFWDITEDTIILLCSDGLSDNDFVDSHWADYCESFMDWDTDLQHTVSQFVALANNYNGHDNISVIAIRVKVCPHPDYK